MTIQQEHYMQQAIELARKGQGRTAPNPPVGAVVVRNGQVVGLGYHPAAGEPHAEVFALRQAGEASNGAEIYVTLEPCCHQGRTGPCTEAIIKAGIDTVVVGSVDPNPLVAGKGVQALRDAGLKVETAVLESQCKDLIKPFAKHLATGFPYVVYKAAMTLDGKTASTDGDSKWISCETSRQLVHELRNHVDAIVVGSGTVNADNPKLTTRLDGGGRDAVRVIIDGALTTSPQATVYRQESEAATILVTAKGHSEEALAAFRLAGVDVLQVDQSGGRLDLKAAMVGLGKRNLQYVLLEGGATLAASMLDAGLIDTMKVFIAPKVLGGTGRGLFAAEGVDSMAEAFRLKDIRSRKVGDDILVEGEVQNVYRSD